MHNWSTVYLLFLFEFFLLFVLPFTLRCFPFLNRRKIGHGNNQADEIAARNELSCQLVFSSLPGPEVSQQPQLLAPVFSLQPGWTCAITWVRKINKKNTWHLRGLFHLLWFFLSSSRCQSARKMQPTLCLFDSCWT